MFLYEFAEKTAQKPDTVATYVRRNKKIFKNHVERRQKQIWLDEKAVDISLKKYPEVQKKQKKPLNKEKFEEIITKSLKTLYENQEILAKEIPEKAYQLAEVFWPGPLTIILKKKELVPYQTTGGLDTVAIRLPANQIAKTLIEKSGVFVAAPSANLSGKPSPTTAQHVIDDLSGKVDMIIDGGHATLGLESTIVDLSGENPMILRPGCITKAMLENVIGEIEYDPVILQKAPNLELVPKAPGMKYRHYAPEGKLTIYEGDIDKVIDAINQKAKDKLESNNRVGVIATDETKALYRYGTVKTIGSRKDEASIAAGLYAVLREFDELHTEYIYTESFADNSLGQAIMNRLLKAAGYRMVKL